MIVNLDKTKIMVWNKIYTIGCIMPKFILNGLRIEVADPYNSGLILGLRPANLESAL